MWGETERDGWGWSRDTIWSQLLSKNTCNYLFLLRNYIFSGKDFFFGLFSAFIMYLLQSQCQLVTLAIKSHGFSHNEAKWTSIHPSIHLVQLKDANECSYGISTYSSERYSRCFHTHIIPSHQSWLFSFSKCFTQSESVQSYTHGWILHKVKLLQHLFLCNL